MPIDFSSVSMSSNISSGLICCLIERLSQYIQPEKRKLIISPLLNINVF